MDTRIYGKAAVVTVSVALGLAALSGCGADGGGPAGGGHPRPARTNSASPAGAAPATSSATSPGTVSAPPPASSSAPAAVTRTPAKPAAPGGNAADLKACYDGRCEISVSRPVTIPVDGRFGFTKFSITHIGAEGVTIAAHSAGTSLESGVSPGGTAALNGLSVKVKSVTGGTALLEITPGQ